PRTATGTATIRGRAFLNHLNSSRPISVLHRGVKADRVAGLEREILAAYLYIQCRADPYRKSKKGGTRRCRQKLVDCVRQRSRLSAVQAFDGRPIASSYPAARPRRPWGFRSLRLALCPHSELLATHCLQFRSPYL